MDSKRQKVEEGKGPAAVVQLSDEELTEAVEKLNEVQDELEKVRYITLKHHTVQYCTLHCTEWCSAVQCSTVPCSTGRYRATVAEMLDEDE